MGMRQNRGRGGVFGPGYRPGGCPTKQTGGISDTAAEIDLAEVGHTIILRCWIVFICKTGGGGVGASGWIGQDFELAITGRVKVRGIPRFPVAAATTRKGWGIRDFARWVVSIAESFVRPSAGWRMVEVR